MRSRRGIPRIAERASASDDIFGRGAELAIARIHQVLAIHRKRRIEAGSGAARRSVPRPNPEVWRTEPRLTQPSVRLVLCRRDRTVVDGAVSLGIADIVGPPWRHCPVVIENPIGDRTGR